MPDFDESLVPSDKPLWSWAKAIVVGGVALARQLDPAAPDIADIAELSGADGLAALGRPVSYLFPL